MTERRTSSYIKNTGLIQAELLVNGEPMLLQPGEGFSITFVQRDKLDEVLDIVKNHKP